MYVFRPGVPCVTRWVVVYQIFNNVLCTVHRAQAHGDTQRVTRVVSTTIRRLSPRRIMGFTEHTRKKTSSPCLYLLGKNGRPLPRESREPLAPTIRSKLDQGDRRASYCAIHREAGMVNVTSGTARRSGPFATPTSGFLATDVLRAPGETYVRTDMCSPRINFVLSFSALTTSFILLLCCFGNEERLD